MSIGSLWQRVWNLSAVWESSGCSRLECEALSRLQLPALVPLVHIIYMYMS